MSDLSIAFITIFGTVASVTGVVLYVFNGTKKLIKEIHATAERSQALIEKMDARMEKMDERMEKMDERTQKIAEIAERIHQENLEIRREREQQHREVVQLLERGFGEVLSEVKTSG